VQVFVASISLGTPGPPAVGRRRLIMKKKYSLLFSAAIYTIVFLFSIIDLVSDRIEPNWIGNCIYGIIVSVSLLILIKNYVESGIAYILNTILWMIALLNFVMYLGVLLFKISDLGMLKIFDDVGIYSFILCLLILIVIAICITTKNWRMGLMFISLNTIGVVISIIVKISNYDLLWFWVMSLIQIIYMMVEKRLNEYFAPRLPGVRREKEKV
jgi:hypothetical protein